MEELYQNVLASFDAETVASTNDFFINALQSPELGQMIVELLGSQNEFASETRFVQSVLGLLRSWFCLHWNDLEPQIKDSFFKAFRLFLAPDKCNISSFAAIYVYMVEKEYHQRQLYEDFVYELLNKLSNFPSLSFETTVAFIKIIYSILKKYKENGDCDYLEISLLLNRFMSSISPILDDESLRTTDDGLIVLKYCLKSVNCLFDRGLASEFIECCINMVISIINMFCSGEIEIESFPRFVAFCFSFVSNILSRQSMEQAEELRQQFFELSIALLKFCLENFNNESYLISSILYLITELKQYLSVDNNILVLFLTATELTEADVTEAIDNPSIYLDKVYSSGSFEKHQPILLAKRLIAYMAKLSKEIASSLLELSFSDASARIIARCANIMNKHELTEALVAWVSEASVDINSDNDFAISSYLFLISKTAKYMDSSAHQQFMEFSFALLDKEHIIIAAAACDLIATLVNLGASPIEEGFASIIELVPEMKTNHVINVLKAIAKSAPQLIAPHAESILSDIMDSIMQNLNAFQEELEIDEDAFRQHINLLETLIVTGGSALVCEPVLEFIQTALNCEDGVYFDDIGRICSDIVKTDSTAVINVINIILEALSSNESALGFISDLGKPILQYISSRKAEFLEANITEKIFSILLPALSDDIEGAIVIGDILSWSLFTDLTIDAATIIEFATLTLESEDIDESISFIALQIFAVLYLSRDYELSEQQIASFIEMVSNKKMRATDKHLFELVFLKLASAGISPDDMFQAAEQCFSGKQDNEEEDNDEDCLDEDEYEDEETDYTFADPFVVIPMSELRNAACMKCSQPVVEALKEKSPSFFEQK